MDNEQQGELESREIDYFGGCPECTHNDGLRNIGRGHWALCHEHRVYWYVGANILSSWRDESEEKWRENSRLLDTYREVEPLWPDWKTFFRPKNEAAYEDEAVCPEDDFPF